MVQLFLRVLALVFCVVGYNAASDCEFPHLDGRNIESMLKGPTVNCTIDVPICVDAAWIDVSALDLCQYRPVKWMAIIRFVRKYMCEDPSMSHAEVEAECRRCCEVAAKTQEFARAVENFVLGPPTTQRPTTLRKTGSRNRKVQHEQQKIVFEDTTTAVTTPIVRSVKKMPKI